ncbi:MAG: GNAT family N-acetyltransferase [Chloroflexi bacterium]|nr:MAG: GNAT family N-acetyltransferase [Chloroflexota bacterium]
MTQERRAIQQFDVGVRNAPLRPREWERLLALDDSQALRTEGADLALVMQDGQLHMMFAFESQDVLMMAFNPMWNAIADSLPDYPVPYVKLDLVSFTNREWLDPMLDAAGFLPFPEWMDLEHRALSEATPPELPDGLSIRRATEADFDRIVAIEADAYYDCSDGEPATRARLAAASWVGVLVEGDAIIGYAINMAPDAQGMGRVVSCAIDSEHWGRQLGQVMLAAATYQLAATGAKQAVVRARPDVTRSVPTAIACGYRPGRSGYELRRTLDEQAILDRIEERRVAGVKVRFGRWH